MYLFPGTRLSSVPEEEHERNTPEWRVARRSAINSELSTLVGEAWTEAGESSTPGVSSEQAEPEPETPGDEEDENEGDGVPNGFWSPWNRAYVKHDKIRCEGCLLEYPMEFEAGLPPWKDGLPKSHAYRLLDNSDGAGLSCYGRKTRTSVRWHFNNPEGAPRSTRWWCFLCTSQDDKSREDFIYGWEHRNYRDGYSLLHRSIKDMAVNQFNWPRHVEFPKRELWTMVWPELD